MRDLIDYQTLLKSELEGLYGESVLKDMSEIIDIYNFYDGPGQKWSINAELDYTPTQLITNLAKKLIKEQARFMFGRTPEFKVKPIKEQLPREIDEETKQQIKQRLEEIDNNAAVIEDIINRILKDNTFSDKLIKGARDCFIGKRVAIKLSASEKDNNIKVMFRPSLEFIYETDPEDIDKLTKIIFFYSIVDSEDKSEQRIWKQKYELDKGKCLLSEGIYNGYGQAVEEEIVNQDTKLDFIPARVIINDGLTGDLKGESDIDEIGGNQNAYNKLKSDDIDALKFHMFPQNVATNASANSLDKIKLAPGALIDLQTEESAPEGVQADMKIIESTFSYDQRFENTINRIKNDMYDLLNVPNVSLEQLKGFMQSGKSMRALYWGLITRCEEKWTVWEPALKWMIESILKMIKIYRIDTLPELEYKIHVEHLYPILEDEEEERRIDMEEVTAEVRSKKSYIDKWDINEDADAELEQIALEKSLLQDSFVQDLNRNIDE